MINTARNSFQSPSFWLLIALLVLASWHTLHFPYLQLWDDSMYADDTLSWLKLMRQHGLLRGFLRGWLQEIPGRYPPMVLLTNLAGCFPRPSLHAMQLAHCFWFAALLFVSRATAKLLQGEAAAFFTVALIGLNPLIFYNGTHILGEPAMFAAMSLVFYWLARYYDSQEPLPGILLGLFLAFGFLSKQHFPFAVAGAIIVWLLYIAHKLSKDKLTARQTGTAYFILLYLAGSTLLCAAFLPWFSQRWRDILIRYGGKRGAFLPHSFHASSKAQLFTSYFKNLYSGLGLILVLLLLLGIMAAVKNKELLFPKLKEKIRFPLAGSFAGAYLFLTFFLIRMDNNNLRFSAPAFIPLGLLAGPGLATLWCQKKTWLRALLIFLLLALPLSLAGKLHAWRPSSPGPLGEFIDQVSQYSAGSEKEFNTYILGSTETFNRRAISAMLKERGNYQHGAPRDFFVSWRLQDNEQELILAKLADADLVLVNQPENPEKIHLFGNPQLARSYIDLVYAELQGQDWRLLLTCASQAGGKMEMYGKNQEK